MGLNNKFSPPGMPLQTPSNDPTQADFRFVDRGSAAPPAVSGTTANRQDATQEQTNGGGPPKHRVRSIKRIEFALQWLREHPDRTVTASELAREFPKELQHTNIENVMIALRDGLRHHPLVATTKDSWAFRYKWNGTVKEEKLNFLPQVQRANSVDNTKCVPTNHRYMHLTDTSIFCEKCGDIIHG